MGGKTVPYIRDEIKVFFKTIFEVLFGARAHDVCTYTAISIVDTFK